MSPSKLSMASLVDLFACEGELKTVKDKLDTLFDRKRWYTLLDVDSIGRRLAAFSESQVADVKILLGCIDEYKAWSRVPRTYIVLRTIDRLDVLPSLIESGFSDIFFPATRRGLPKEIGADCIAAILEHQAIIYTEILAREHHDGSHWCIGPSHEPPFTEQACLAISHFAKVDKVSSNIDQKVYARKSMHRHHLHGYERSTAQMKKFKSELTILKMVSHRHIVRFVGSYSEEDMFTLLMDPAADQDFTAYLREMPGNPESKSVLRTYFGCLAGAVKYLHEYGEGKGIRHKDIKPVNILVYKGNVLLTDFGLSFHYNEGQDTTTSGPAAKTRKYCAPEVAGQSSRWSWQAADMWSLGCVFLEMVTVLDERPFQGAEIFFGTKGINGSAYHTSADVLGLWLSELERTSSTLDSCCMGWVRQMLQHIPANRPTASRLFEIVTCSENSEGEAGHHFCGSCCFPLRKADSTVRPATLKRPNEDGDHSFPSSAVIKRASMSKKEVDSVKSAELVAKRLSAQEFESCHVYVLHDQITGVVRVGTVRTADGFQHIVREWNKRCEANSKIIVVQSVVFAGKRLKALVFCELLSLGTSVEIQCSCGYIHHELLDVSSVLALRSVQRWYQFVRLEPYDSEGYLKKEWLARLRRHTPESEEQWDNFVDFKGNVETPGSLDRDE